MAADVSDILAQQELLQEIGDRLRSAVPEGWARLRYEVRFCHVSTQHFLYVTGADGSESRVRPPLRVGSLSNRLRHAMATPDGGTWLSMSLLLTPDGQVSADFNYDRQPDWVDTGGGVPPAEAYGEELKQYPRSPENVPAWWRDLINGIDPNNPDMRDVSVQAVMSPSGGEPTRERWTTTPETAAAAETFAAGMAAAGYTTERSTDESDPDALPDGVTNVFQLVDLDGGTVSFFDTGAFLSFSLGETTHQSLTKLWTTVADAVTMLREQQGWTLSTEEQDHLDEQVRLGTFDPGA